MLDKTLLPWLHSPLTHIARLLRWLAYGMVRAMVGIAGYGQRHWHSHDVKPEGR